MQDQQNHQKIIEANVTVISFKSYRLTVERLQHGVPEALRIINTAPEPGFYLIDVDNIINRH